jgi:tol-pal system protein YbgF
MTRCARLIGLVCAALAAQIAGAVAPVVESQPTTSSGTTRPPATTYPSPSAPSTSTSSGVRAYGADQGEIIASETRSTPPPSSTVSSSPAANSSASGSSATSMFQQFQQLQDDVAELRGMVEEQAHQIARLQADQKEQYIDLDRRVAALSGGTGPTAAAGGGATSGPTTSGGGGPVTTGPVASANNSERDAYTTAFNMTKDKRFNEAIAAFNQLLVTYPKGEYSGNAYYWLGELYLAQPEPALEKSRQSFAQVVGQYPTNPKISDAMYKLGVVYHRLGDKAKALEYLNRVQSQYPGTQAAKLAQAYAAELR